MAVEWAVPLLKIATTLANAGGMAILSSRRAADERELTLAQLATARGLGVIPIRRLSRQIDQLAETVFERMQSVVEDEFRGLEENEKSAALLAVADVLHEIT
jgi:hypothetical protein